MVSAPRAYSYLRFSSPEQINGDSFRRQEQRTIEYAERHGLLLDDELTFKDLGVSAFRGRNAESGRLAAFLEAVRTGVVPTGSILLIESLDRLTRNKVIEAQTLFMGIITSGITIVTLQDEKVLSHSSLNENPMDLMYSFIVMVRANEESESKSFRVSQSWAVKRSRAAHQILTSVGPHWLVLRQDRSKFDIIEKRADVVRRVFAPTLEGKGQQAITRILNSENVPLFGRGRRWYRTVIAKWLQSESVIGTYTSNVVEYVDGKRHLKPVLKVSNYYPRILDNEIFYDVQSLLESRAPMRGRHALKKVSNILGCLTQCPLCGGSMTLQFKNARDKYLICTKALDHAGCERHPVHYLRIERAVTEQSERWLCPESILTEPSPMLQQEFTEVSAEIEKRRQFVSMLFEEMRTRGRSSPTITLKLFEEEREINAMETRKLMLERQLQSAATPYVNRRVAELLDIMRQEPLDKSRANTIMRQLFSAVVINYVSSRLDFLWRNGHKSHCLLAPDRS